MHYIVLKNMPEVMTLKKESPITNTFISLRLLSVFRLFLRAFANYPRQFYGLLHKLPIYNILQVSIYTQAFSASSEFNGLIEYKALA